MLSSEKAPLTGKEDSPRPWYRRWWALILGLLLIAITVPIVVVSLQHKHYAPPPLPPMVPPSPPGGPPPPFGDPLCGSGVLKGIGLQDLSWTPGLRRAVLRLRCMGGNAVLLRIGCQQTNLTSLHPVCPHPESFDGLPDLIRRLRCAGLRVGLQAELHSQDGAYSQKYDTGVWAAYIGTDAMGGTSFTAAEWAAWSAAWSTQLVRWAAYSEAHRVSLFSIGAELTVPQKHTGVWEAIVPAVRAVFSGNVTYGADKGSVHTVKWWDALDYIGTDSYYSKLGPGDDPTTDELDVAWATKTRELWDAAATYNRPVLVHEIGFRSYTGANVNPGAWQAGGSVNNELQQRLWSTMLYAMCPKSSREFAGMFVNGLSDFGTNPTGYELTGKPACDTIARAWGGTCAASGVAGDASSCPAEVIAAFERCNASSTPKLRPSH